MTINHLRISSILFLFTCVLSCKKEYVDVVAPVPGIEIIDSAFRVDSVSIVNLINGKDYVDFDIKIHGNPLNNVYIEIKLNGRQTGYNTGDDRYRIDNIAPNTLFGLQVNIRSKQDWYEILTSDTAYFSTANNVNSINRLYDHRKAWRALDHVPATDGGSVFLSYGDLRRIYTNHPTFPYQFVIDLNIFKTNKEGDVVWREESWDLKATSEIPIEGNIQLFKNGDLLVVLGVEIRRYSAGGKLIWKYSADAVSEQNEFSDAEIMDDGSIYAVGSVYDLQKGRRGRILHLSEGGKLLADREYTSSSKDISSFKEICRMSENELYVIGIPQDDQNMGIAKLVDMELVWVKKLVDHESANVSHFDISLEKTPDHHLVVSSRVAGLFTYRSWVLKLNASANMIAARYIDYFHVKDAALSKDGTLYLTGANEYGMFPGYNRLLLLDKNLEVQKDISFQGGYGSSLGYSIQVLPEGLVSIFGICAGLQWHSLFSN